MTWVLWALAALWVVDALRLRGRLGALRRVSAGEGGRPDDEVLGAQDLSVSPAVAASASAWAAVEGLDVVDLVPSDLSAYEALLLAQQVDPAAYRADRLAAGYSTGHAVLASAEVRRRAAVPAHAARSDGDLRALAATLKRFSPAGTGLAVAPGLHARPFAFARHARVLRDLWAGNAPFVLGGQLLLLGLMVAGLFDAETRFAASIAVICFHLHPLVATGGGPITSRDLALVTALRLPLDLLLWAATLRAWAGDRARAARVAARRSHYQALESTVPPAARFEPRRDACPICGGAELAPHLEVPDLYQRKPGRFTLDRCGGCGTVFQNPRLSIAGLDYYYGDFYEGLGEEALELVFRASGDAYRSRARTVDEACDPRRWLDVGTGHGHFPNAARASFPGTTFDGLDLNEEVEAAARQGWIDRAWRGLFTELAPEMAAEPYDLVSMSHYLEHTLDPRAELAAAAQALVPGGHLLIEVPDPECRLGRLLGRWWLPWFQPQHLHLIPPDTLGRLLDEEGFEPVTWCYGEAHQAVDFLFASMLVLEQLGPEPDRAWQPPPGALRRARHGVVWALGVPLVALGALVDRLLRPLTRRRGWSNGYRVLARRRGADELVRQ